MQKSVKASKKPSKPKKKVQKKQPELNHIPTKLRKLIGTSVNDYIKVLGIGNYKVKTFYMKKDVEVPGDSSVLASMNVDMRYLNANLYIYPSMIRNWNQKIMDDEDIKDAIAHEISHIATNHMYMLATSIYKDEGEMKDAWESLTTVIGRLVHEIDSHRKK